MLNEENIIGYLKSQFRDSASIVGIGDDAAIFPKNEQESYVISKDLLVEEQHFRLRYYDAATLAQKALQVNLSDIAAMGAKPHSVLLGLALPPACSEMWLNTFLESFVEACKKSSVILLGGDTTASPQHLFISVTAIGEVSNTNLKKRNTAQVGDVVCVAGKLGEAHADFLLLEKHLLNIPPLCVQAKVQEGLWFGNYPEVHAMMDISDGLYLDLSRLCQASQVGAEVILDGIIPSRKLIEACAVLTLDPLQCMLVGGEDYGLLVTIDPHQYELLAAAFLNKFGYSLIRVGSITEQSGVRLIQNNQEIPMAYHPFSHFGEL